MKRKLVTVDAETLLSTPMSKTMFIVDKLIPQGVNVLSGAAKIGKSWLMLWLGLQVTKGLPVWGIPTMQCDVLYLCLEDTQRRIKDRLYDLTDDSKRSFHLAVTCGLIGNGLEEEIVNFLEDFPKTKLVIIDTLQKVRDSKGGAGKTGMYGNDYDDISSIKRIADQYNIAIILVHHLRKMKDSDDPFNEVSGSTGITGAADTNYVLKRKRSSKDATLLACGRDVEYQELTLRFNNFIWELVEHKNTEEIRKAEIPQFLFRVVEFMKTRTEWMGTATDLVADMAETETTPNVVTKYLGQFYYEVLEPAGIEYRARHVRRVRAAPFRRAGARGREGAGDRLPSLRHGALAGAHPEAPLPVHEPLSGRARHLRPLHDARQRLDAGVHRLHQHGRLPAQAAAGVRAGADALAYVRQRTRVRRQAARASAGAHGHLAACGQRSMRPRARRAGPLVRPAPLR